MIGPNNTPIVIAGGGGGASASFDGQGGLTGLDGGNNGGTGGQGGSAGSGIGNGGGAGGGGFLTSGADSFSISAPGQIAAHGGTAYPSLAGGAGGGGGGNGGFVGGGGGSSGAAGGAGGYSGGGGGSSSLGFSGSGGGDGSFNAGTNQILVADVQAGDGAVVITGSSLVFQGAPGHRNCHGQSVAALASEFGGLDNAASTLGIRTFCRG